MRIWIVALAMVGAALALWAQDKEGPGKDYRLQEEDVLSFALAQGQEGAFRTTIGPDGYVEYPHIGRVMVKGRTTSEVIEEIRSRLISSEIYLDPTITLIVETYRRPQATVIGTDTVQRPNTYPFRLGQRLRDLIGLAGGVIYGQADMQRAVLTRKGSGERIPVDLRALLQASRDDQNFELRDGDVLTVPREEKGYVNVVGEVNQPGPIQWRDGMRVSDAIAAARGYTAERGSPAKVRVLRPDPYDPSKLTEIGVNMFEAQKDITKDVALLKQDTITVGKNNNVDINRYNSVFNAAYVLTILIRNNPFDALVGAFRR